MSIHACIGYQQYETSAMPQMIDCIIFDFVYALVKGLREEGPLDVPDLRISSYAE